MKLSKEDIQKYGTEEEKKTLNEIQHHGLMGHEGYPDDDNWDDDVDGAFDADQMENTTTLIVQINRKINKFKVMDALVYEGFGSWEEGNTLFTSSINDGVKKFVSSIKNKVF